MRCEILYAQIMALSPLSPVIVFPERAALKFTQDWPGRKDICISQGKQEI